MGKMMRINLFVCAAMICLNPIYARNGLPKKKLRKIYDVGNLKGIKKFTRLPKEYDRPFLKGYPLDVPFELLATKNQLGPHHNYPLLAGSSPWLNIPYERNAYILELKDWYIDPKCNGTIFNASQMFTLRYNKYIPYAPVDVKDVRKRNVVEIEKGVHLLQPCAEGFYHFVIEVLSRLTLAMPIVKKNPSVKLLLLGPEQPFMRPFLHMLGIKDDRIVFCDPQNIYKVGQLYFPKPTYMGYPSKEEIARVRKYVLAHHKKVGMTRDLILVVKRLVKRRNLKNADQIVTSLKSAFPRDKDKIVTFTENLPLSEQIELFRRAKLVIGPHGAAFANMIFSAPGCTNIELLPEEYCSILFWHIAQAMGHDHHHILLKSVGFNSQFEVEPDLIIRKIKELEIL